MNGFDINELFNFETDLLNLADDTPKEAKKMLRKEGTKLKNKTVKNAKSKVKVKTGAYVKGIKRGKVYKYRDNGALSVRVYGASPHAHLIEHGHRQVTADGKEVGFVEGKHVFEDTAKDFEKEYYNDIDQFLNDLLDKV